MGDWLVTTRRRVGRKMPTVSEPSFASVTTPVSLARNVAANATLREKRRSPINNISFLVDRLCTSAVFVSSNVPIFGKNDARVCSGKYTADDDFASVVPERGICTIDRRRSIEKRDAVGPARISLKTTPRSTTLHHVRVLLPALEKRTLAPKGVRRDAYVKQLQSGHCNRKRKQIFFFFFLRHRRKPYFPLWSSNFRKIGCKDWPKVKEARNLAHACQLATASLRPLPRISFDSNPVERLTY